MKSRLIIDVALILALLVGWFYVKKVERSRDDMLAKVNFLADNLDAQVTVSDGFIRQLERLKGGGVKSRTTYVPPEGKITVSTPKDGKPVVKLITSGLVFRPGLGLSYSEGFKPSASVKLFFFGRYGLIANFERAGIYGGISRHLDDIAPVWKPQNLELFAAYELCAFTDELGKVRIGIRVSL